MRLGAVPVHLEGWSRVGDVRLVIGTVDVFAVPAGRESHGGSNSAKAHAGWEGCSVGACTGGTTEGLLVSAKAAVADSGLHAFGAGLVRITGEHAEALTV